MTERRYAALSVGLCALGATVHIAGWLLRAPTRDFFVLCLIGMLWAQSARHGLMIQRLLAGTPAETVDQQRARS